MKVLITMHPGLQRRRPTRRIHPYRPLPLPPFLNPRHQQTNRILRPLLTPQSRRDPLRRTRTHFNRRKPLLLHHTLTNINMVRVQVIRNIRILARPRLERLQLALRLTHITIKIIPISQRLRLKPRIGVSRIIAFVMLDVDEDAVFAGGGEERQMVGERFDTGFRD